MARKRRTFSEEFKAEAVRIVRESEKTVAQVAKELDLTQTCLRAWMQRDEAVKAGTGLTPQERRLAVATSGGKAALRRCRWQRRGAIVMRGLAHGTRLADGARPARLPSPAPTRTGTTGMTAGPADYRPGPLLRCAGPGRS